MNVLSMIIERTTLRSGSEPAEHNLVHLNLQTRCKAIEAVEVLRHSQTTRLSAVLTLSPEAGDALPRDDDERRLQNEGIFPTAHWGASNCNRTGDGGNSTLHGRLS